jgi:hypothetical protein
MKNLIPFELFEANINEAEKRKKMFLYHGVKKQENVDSIIKNGFDLRKINNLWVNDYAISTLTTPAAVYKFFGKKDITVLKLEFDGVIATSEDVRHIQVSDAKDYTRKVVAMGIDAVMLDGTGARQVFVYNTKAIKKISKFTPPSADLGS